MSFRSYLNEVNVGSKLPIFKYKGYSNSGNLPGIGGTYLYLEDDNGFTFGVCIFATEDFSARIMPNIPDDWRRVFNDKDMGYFNQYFGDKKYDSKDPLFKAMIKNGLNLGFSDAKELVKFLKTKTDNYDKIIGDILNKSRERVPADLKEILMKGIKLSAFEKKLQQADNVFDKFQLLIKQYKPVIGENGYITFKDGSTELGYLKIDKYYWYINSNFNDERIAMLLGSQGKVHVEIYNFFAGSSGPVDKIEKYLSKSGILNAKQQKAFMGWMVNQRK